MIKVKGATSRRLGFFTALAAFLILGTITTSNANSVTYNVDMPSQSLNDALQALALTSQHKLLYSSELVDGRTAPPLKGEYTTEQAVKLLLKGTDLTYELTRDGLMLIREKSPRAAGRTASLGGGEGAGTEDEESTRLTQNNQGSTNSDPGRGENESASRGEAPATAPSSSREIDTIVVTAQKREERLQDVPIAITVLGGVELDRTSMSVIDELKRVPGMAALAIEGGTDSVALSVRGVTSTANQFGGTSTVGYYLDSVPFGFVRQAFSPDSSAYDLERVEVLRGPQGTLYGVNSLNGVVRVLTKEPNLDDFETKFRLSTSMVEDGGQGYRADAAVNIPVVTGKFAARAVVGYEDSPGWVDAPFSKDINDRQTRNARLKLKAMPTDNLSVGFMAWHSESLSDNYSASFEDRTVATVRSGEATTEYDVFVLDLEYAFPNFVLNSSSSYIDFGTDVFAPPATAGGLVLLSEFMSEIFAQEITLNSTSAGPWKWSVGAIYRDVNDAVHQNLLSNLTGLGIFPNPNGLGYKDLSESYAIFGELTRSFHDGAFDITAGLRYFEDENGIRQTDNLIDPMAPLIVSDAEFDSVSPRLVFSWHASDLLTAYASYAEGFRSGFGQSPTTLAVVPTLPAVQEDNLTNYELGAKGSALGGLISFDAAVFYLDWENTQLPLRVPIPGSTAVLAALVNFEGASGPGAEAGVTFKPVSGLDITVNGSWSGLEADVDALTIIGTTNVLLIPKGDRLPYSPEWTGNLLVDYRFPLGNFEAVASGGVSYLSEMPFYFTTGTLGRVNFSEESWISRASFALTSPRGWTTSLFVENLTDENVVLNPITGGGAIEPVVRPRPRTLGLQFEYRM